MRTTLPLLCYVLANHMIKFILINCQILNWCVELYGEGVFVLIPWSCKICVIQVDAVLWHGPRNFHRKYKPKENAFEQFSIQMTTSFLCGWQRTAEQHRQFCETEPKKEPMEIERKRKQERRRESGIGCNLSLKDSNRERGQGWDFLGGTWK